MAANLANDPKNAVITVLRSRLTDYNSGNRASSDKWIYPDFPNLNLGKNSYPRISVTHVTETAEVVDVARNMLYTTHLQIDVWVWDPADGRDPLLVDVSGTKYSGQKLLDLLGRDVVEALDDNKSDFDDDTNILHNYQLAAYVDMGHDKSRPQVIRKRIEVMFDYYRG